MKIRDIYLTEHFRVGEFGCKCGKCNQEGLNIDRKLVYMLETLRREIQFPIKIISGIRCSLHNHKVGGATFSFHITGQAADISCHYLQTYGLWRVVSELNPNGLGYYPDENFIHIDTGNRFSRWTRKDGKYIYWLK